jgi:hypothetical protein
LVLFCANLTHLLVGKLMFDSIAVLFKTKTELNSWQKKDPAIEAGS